MTKIQWTDITENPIHLIQSNGEHGGHWCQKISEGCARCYSETLNQSSYYSFASHLPFTGQIPENLILNRNILASWKRAKKPQKRFICSMTDWLGDWVPQTWQFEMIEAMTEAPLQTFQLLTKRADNLEKLALDWSGRSDGRILFPSNVWTGVSIENQYWADRRIPLVCGSFYKNFLSIEPILEQIEIKKFKVFSDFNIYSQQHPFETINGIKWAIVGGESGKNARECDLSWIRSLIVQCQKYDVPIFVKQLGSNPTENGKPIKLKDKKGGNIEEWPDDLKIRQFPFSV